MTRHLSFLILCSLGFLMCQTANASNVQDYSIHAQAVNYPYGIKLLDLQSTGIDVSRASDSSTNFIINGAGWLGAWVTSGDITAKYGSDANNYCAVKFHLAYVFQWNPEITSSCTGNLSFYSSHYDGSYDYTLSFGPALA